MPPIRLLFFDIDGTLVSFKTHAIPASTVRVLTEVHRRGVKIIIATGRARLLIDNLAAIEHLIDGYVTINGAYNFVGGEVVGVHPIDPADVAAALSACTRLDVPCLVVGERDVAVHNPQPIVEDIFRSTIDIRNIDYQAPPEPLLASQPVMQLTPFVTEEQERQLMAATRSCVSARWHPAFADITSVQADKGQALLAMAAHLGVAPAQTMAFGDGGNDVAMVRTAGIGVAMGNAIGELKAVADHVTTAIDDDGILQALRHYGLVE